MSNIKVVLDTTAVRKNILQADFMVEECARVAQAKGGSDSHVKSFIGYDRARAIVYPNQTTSGKTKEERQKMHIKEYYRNKSK